jgi:hypothetical protein
MMNQSKELDIKKEINRLKLLETDSDECSVSESDWIECYAYYYYAGFWGNGVSIVQLSGNSLNSCLYKI